MKENQLLRISIIFSLIGILILFYLTGSLEPRAYEINSLTKDNIDDVVKVNGRVSSFSETPGLYLINLKDDTVMITVVVFKDDELELMEGMEIEIVGQVTEYQDRLELIAKEIVS